MTQLMKNTHFDVFCFCWNTLGYGRMDVEVQRKYSFGLFTRELQNY